VRSMAKGRLRPARPAIGRVRYLVGCGDARADRHVVDLVGAGQMHRGVVDHTHADRIPCPTIHDEIIAERQDEAVVIEPNLNIVESDRANGTSTSDARAGPRSI